MEDKLTVEDLFSSVIISILSGIIFPIVCMCFTFYGALSLLDVQDGTKIELALHIGGVIICFCLTILSIAWLIFGISNLGNLMGSEVCSKELINSLREENKRLKAENRNNDTPKKEFVEVEEKKDNLLFEVAKWAIECGNGLSTSAVQRHFSVGYSRAGKIVDQLFGLGLCARSTGNSKPRAMLIDMDQLMQLERSGALAGTMKYKL